MHTSTALVRPSQPYLFSFRAIRDVCVWFLEREWVCTFPSSTYTVICPTTIGQCRLWDSLMSYCNRSQLIWRSAPVLHDLHLIHTDLKPENILLVHNNYKTSAVPVPGKVFFRCFLSAICTYWPQAQRTAAYEAHITLDGYSTYWFWIGYLRRGVSLYSRFYSPLSCPRNYSRSVIDQSSTNVGQYWYSTFTGLGWSYPCDAYSLGCILVEFYTGVALYQTHDNLEHLAMMEMVMDKMPDRFARAGSRTKPEFFKEGNRLDWPKAKASRQSKKDVRATRRLSVCPSYRNEKQIKITHFFL